ncbi:thymidylate synthase [Buchnera aphidicola]|uniref:Thymidylate synthase n=1 Tax=Buchnera aphidicola str. USDA (Myzus persicae) TaxID=1009856 RepID=W0P3L3_BUCMP|nr:thymidylate synthase [Buchnera aphidicola]AHG59955.1 Thya [Buchnera aphidicola str. USDA (Myzus persicae)]AHG60535.1 Thya [Buchnera aphidicola str. W106 (Myzus persicae)]AHG61108.1 Thya [Buchnera aphidicola str. G002 (Myzus persicae)]AHG61680.1 Thya [Buchnera aphidicola str. F009 (Myzus persicae)]WAI03362.1 MAG: thymidylate synthase [Buchnera aphidicola (Myzus persicae)]
MKQYLALIKKIIKIGNPKKDRTGTGTLSIFGHHMKFNLKKGFPLVTTKKCHIPSIIHELLWFLKGDTNIKYLNQNKISIWNNWADEQGEVGPIYGKQWRNWNTSEKNKIDQIKNILIQLKKDPDSRRILVSSWNVGEINKMKLPPCHILFQFYVFNKKLSCQLYQRSCDVFLGLPFNIASYAILIHMIAQQCDLEVGEFLWTGGDVHLYNNHIELAKKQVLRSPKKLPKLVIIQKPPSLFQYSFQDFKIVGYTPDPAIKAAISI